MKFSIRICVTNSKIKSYSLFELAAPYSTQLVNNFKYFLQTTRLGFRLWTEDDFHLAFDLWGDNAVTELIGGPFTIEKIQGWK